MILALALMVVADPSNSEIFLRCVEREAIRLEPSREQADIVADAAVGACETERLAAALGIAADKGTGYVRAAADALQMQGRRTALLKVVGLRAARAR